MDNGVEGKELKMLCMFGGMGAREGKERERHSLTES